MVYECPVDNSLQDWDIEEQEPETSGGEQL